jgi:Zn finger protein HypA/HybF involved in hydrogenase expression
MHRLALSDLLLLAACFVLLGTSVCFALDEDGCLTCHQYPGLVRLEKDNDLRVLHIDEEKYLSSAHGQVRCKKCHTVITEVPHTGKTSTECTTECHQKDAEKIASFPLTTLHNGEQFYLVRLQDRTSCRVCHPIYPHSENKRVRAFLNMHTGFMYCEVCHINRSKIDHLVYDWKNTENADFSGEPFGTYFNPRTNTAHKADEHFISRVAVFSLSEGKKQELMDTQDTEAAAAFIRAKNTLSSEVEKKKLEYFHRDIERKEISVACDECHSEDSILDFNKLGFDDKKTKQLIYINIKGLVTKYKVFYFPRLFED